jgi:hypothetical protein
MRTDGMRLAAILGAAALLGACAQAPRQAAEAAPQAAACPDGVPAGVRCLRGQDSAGAHYLIAMPAQWNGVLVVHAHGGPTLGQPKVERADEDAKRWAIVPRAGYAYAASVFRQGGVAVRSAAEDTERVRRIFVDHVARPKRTILHGQSWGAHVAAKAAELYAGPHVRRPPYDAVLLTSGVLGGGTPSYDFRLDLRVVYQYLCGNHPKPDEPAYPLWQGLPADSTLTRAELAARADECLGVRRPAAQRSPEQASRLKTLVEVIRIPEAQVVAHLNWATWHFQDIALHRAGGNVFGNERVRYAGSPDDAALNAGVARYRADPVAVARFHEDTGLAGRIGVPVLTVHAVGDPTAFVELESAFRETMERGGSAARLVQAYTGHTVHSYLDHAVYPTALEALLRWVEAGDKPTPAALAARCAQMEATFGPGCRFMPHYSPAPLASRVAARGP